MGTRYTSETFEEALKVKQDADKYIQMLQRDHPSESDSFKRHLQQRIDFEKEVLSVKEAAQKHFLSSS